MADLWLICHGCKTGRFIPKERRADQAEAFRTAHRLCGIRRHWADRYSWEALKAKGYREVGA